jgi:nicotinic acid mononucleotide adenylyltransferase
MKSLEYKEAYSRIYRKLLSTRWLNKWNIDKNLMETVLRDNLFLEEIFSLIEDKDFSCRRTLKLCEKLLEVLPEEGAPSDWLYYIYQYTLNKSFPQAVAIELLPVLDRCCEVYLRVLRIICEIQKYYEDGTWQSLYPIEFLTEEEEKELEDNGEYKRFVNAFKVDCIYEMMKLNGEVMKFNTLDHVCGVHNLALFIARQLKTLGISVDLGRVSGAAAGHDIGKYGCVGAEVKRVPYLHYYYSDQWLKRHGINYIRNIAVNHSTWDLELENLSLEGLILIYSDFRVKNKHVNGRDTMFIFTLEDSFNVILEKLDDVDSVKEKRYRRVYAKLKDFESFLISLNIKTDIATSAFPEVLPENPRPDYALMHGETVVENLKFMAIRHNISLMHKLRDEYSLDAILEAARSEKDWKNLREYIRIFEEYSTYLTQKQKLQTIRFLYENLIHPEDDIRKHCAEIIGTLIAIFDEDYRKELPQNVIAESMPVKSIDLLREYIELLLYPGHKIISSHRYWMGYSLSTMTGSLFSHCRPNLTSVYRNIFISYFSDKAHKSTETQLFLIETAKCVSMEAADETLDSLFDFILSMMNKRSSILRLSALECALEIIPRLPANNKFIVSLKSELNSNEVRSTIPTENLLILKLCKALNLGEKSSLFEHYCRLDERKIPDIFLSNLKTATDWVKKKNQVDMLLNYTLNTPHTNSMHTAIHFCNLLKVSAVENVRNTAGVAILRLMARLTASEKNEIAVELLRALEIEGHRFTEYIPRYLGQVILHLEPKELDEIIDDLTLKIKVSKPNVKSLLLKTMGVTAEYYTVYRDRFEEKEEAYEDRLKRILGILLNGLGDYNLQVKRSALSAFGKELFGSRVLKLDQKLHIFKLTAKKLLTLITSDTTEDLLFLSASAGLNHIYRFISDYTFFYDRIDLQLPERIAFFPGTFDPFSLSHKEIARSIRDLGYEVYLSIDEFSWSKRTLPNLLRRSILSISTADEFGMFIYPDRYPTNIANTEDLLSLKNNFPASEVYMVVGSDVVLNASSYTNPATEHSIHSFPHVIFERGKSRKLEEAAKNILGRIEWLSLPAKYDDISSTQIRNYIDENRDISSLIDPLAQQYIYENGFYQREPQDKITVKAISINVEIINSLTLDLLNELCSLMVERTRDLKKIIIDVFSKPSGRSLLLRDNETGKILAFSLFHWIRSSVLFEELKDAKVSEYIRQHSLGRMLMLDGLFVYNGEKNKSLEQVIVTETLAFCISRDYEYAIFKAASKELGTNSICDLLRLQGFIPIESQTKSAPVYVVDMSSPCVLNLDVENLIKEPFRTNPRIKQSIASSRRNLQENLTKLYPGELILSFDSNMLYQTLIKKICRENQVPTEISVPRNLGPYMCVPYGDILDRYVIPNTVTKSLHTEKLFYPDMQDFKIGEFPHYLDLDNQIRMLKSFQKPVILVDNILHKGYRMRALDPLFKKEGVKVQKIIAGILSGRGKDLMDMQNREVDCAYFIPRLKIWFNENALYPFIGGDSLWRGSYPERNLFPSINLIMPYTSPVFIRNSSINAIYDLSKICIENAMIILSALETEYHTINERNLTLSSLGQVLTIPRCPDHGRDMEYDLNLNPSHYLTNDLELLNRFETMIKFPK